MAEKLITVARYPHPTPAHIARKVLESRGIPCQLIDEASSVACCGSKTEVLIRVYSKDVDRARKALQLSRE